MPKPDLLVSSVYAQKLPVNERIVSPLLHNFNFFKGVKHGNMKLVTFYKRPDEYGE